MLLYLKCNGRRLHSSAQNSVSARFWNADSAGRGAITMLGAERAKLLGELIFDTEIEIQATRTHDRGAAD